MILRTCSELKEVSGVEHCPQKVQKANKLHYILSKIQSIFDFITGGGRFEKFYFRIT